MREIRVRSLGREDPLEKEMATHSSIHAQKILWTEEPGGLQSMGLQRVRHNWATSAQLSSRFTLYRHCHQYLKWTTNYRPVHLIGNKSLVQLTWRKKPRTYLSANHIDRIIQCFMKESVELQDWWKIWNHKHLCSNDNYSLSNTHFFNYYDLNDYDPQFSVMLSVKKRDRCWKIMTAKPQCLTLTWNDWNCFQRSENSECSQCGDIAQVHKLCHISVIGSSHTNTVTGYKERAIGTRSLMLYTDHFLPGITEIVFKALKTLKVWTAEKLPRLTNSVTYLQN